MEQDEVLSLISSLQIQDDADGEVIPLHADIHGVGKKMLDACLACKVVSTKAMPREVFRSQVPKLLQLVGSTTVEIIGNNLFILEFSSLMDHKRILSNGPWNLFRNLLLFQEISELTRVDTLCFNTLDIWVQFHNVPLSCMNRACAEMISSHIGTVVEVATGLKGECWGRYLRVRVSIDITKPLKRVLRVALGSELIPVTMLLLYERLPLFCHRCGIIGHQIKECLKDAELGLDGKEIIHFGSWMTAPQGGFRSRSRGDDQELCFRWVISNQP
ncbi:hypothetical protein UlMin_044550 [Ulmus minor]